MISFVLPEDQDRAVLEINHYIDELLRDARESHPGIDYYVTGDVRMHRAFALATLDDLQTLTPIVLVIIVGLAATLLGSIAGTIAIVVVIMFAVNTTVGLAGWLSVVFSPTSAGVQSS